MLRLHPLEGQRYRYPVARAGYRKRWAAAGNGTVSATVVQSERLNFISVV